MEREIVIVVYPQSYVTVRHFVDYLCGVVAEVTGRPANLRVTATMEEARPNAGSIVLLIGFRFPDFRRLPGCYTVFLNFSVMYPVRGLLYSSWSAIRMMRAKRKAFLEKLPALDVVLDFHAQHALVLRQKITPVPVFTFPVNVAVSSGLCRHSIAECEYDVCVVGQSTRRRRRIYGELEQAGLRLSPCSTDDFPGTVSRSRFVLNVRSHRYDNLELPRIVTALAVGRCVLTEHAYGLGDVIPADVCFAESYGRIAGRAVQLASDLATLQSTGDRALAFIRDQYNEKCKSQWALILEQLQQAAEEKMAGRPMAAVMPLAIQAPGSLAP